MNIFRWPWNRNEPAENDLPIDVDQPMLSEAMAQLFREDVIDNNASTPDQALSKMLAALEIVLNLSEPPEEPDQPSPRVAVVSLVERPLAIGNRRGVERRGPFPVVELKGGRLDATLRFQVWGSDYQDADDKAEELQEKLLAARDSLWALGFLRIAAIGTSLAEHVPSLEAWRRTADYAVLYEYHYQDNDGAESIIARIPVFVDSEYGESTVVTDEMALWDDRSAPALQVRAGNRRSFRVGSLFALACLPDGWDGSGVTLSASVDSAILEKDFPSMRDFIGAFTLAYHDVTSPGGVAVILRAKSYDIWGKDILITITDASPDVAVTLKYRDVEEVYTVANGHDLATRVNNRSVIVNALAGPQAAEKPDLCAETAFNDLGTAELGGKLYRSCRMLFPNIDFPEPIILKGGDDAFGVRYDGTFFDGDAVVYLRVTS